MLRVGLTGGIGSGKSTVASYFSELGVPIIDADEIAHELTSPSNPLFNEIISHFGQQFLEKDGSLDRRQLRDLVFKKPQERKWLEQLLHPPILAEMKKRLEKLTHPYVILTIPLLVEYGPIEFVDRILVVDTPERTQIERAQERDRSISQTIENIIQSQSSREKRLEIAEDVISNDADLASLRRKVKRLHDFYLKLAA